MSDRSSTPVSGSRDLDLALVQPDFPTVSATAVTQTLDPVATATAPAASDVATSRLQNLAPRAPSPVPSVCGTESENGDSIGGDAFEATETYNVVTPRSLTPSSTVQIVTATTTVIHATSGQNVSVPVPPQAYTTAATAAVQAGQPVPNPPMLGPVQTCSPQYTYTYATTPRSAVPSVNTRETGMRLRSGHTLPPRPVPTQVNRPTATRHVQEATPSLSNPPQPVAQNVPPMSVVQLTPLLAQPQTLVTTTPLPFTQASPPASNPYPQPLPHVQNVPWPSPVPGIGQVFQSLGESWATTSASQQVGYLPPVTGTAAPWAVDRDLMTDLERVSSHQLAHVLNGLDGAGAPPVMPAPRCGAQTVRSRASTGASSRISMTSTQFRDAIDEALKAQAQETAAQAEERERRLLQEQAKQTLEMKREMAAQAKQMERLVRGAAREAATKATKDAAKSFREQQERSEVARRHHQVFTSPPLPTPPGSCHLGPRSRSLENVPRASAQNDHVPMPPRPGTPLSDQCPHSPVSSPCPTSGQGTGTTIVQNRPVSPATSRVTVSADTNHQSPVRSAHEHAVQYAQPLRAQAAVCELPPAQVPVATQPPRQACVALPPMPTTRASAPPPQAFAEASSALHPFMNGQTENRAFPTVTPIPKLPSSDMPSPGKHSPGHSAIPSPQKAQAQRVERVFWQ